LLQDTNSRSFVVRAYYRSRLFMGFCCICCEVLYLALYLLSWQTYAAPALALPAVAVHAAAAAGGRVER
jgi:CDP-diacylglycerol--inositol 3-phosphatidyltransferase